MGGTHLLETWDVHNRINLYLLDAVEPAALASYSASKGRSVGAQFAHIHNVRLMWLKAAAPDLLGGLEKLEDARSDASVLSASLEASGAAIGELLARGLESGRIKRFKPHPTAFLAYLVSHESFHHGDLGVR